MQWTRADFILVSGFALILAILPLGNAAQAAPPESKVTICHFPPGNPGNVHQITVGGSAVPAHVTNHHDAVCAAGASDCCFQTSSAPSVCTSFASDVTNCGSCGNHCVDGQICSSGTCVCPTGTALCGSACVNESTDNNNCGACGHVCSAGTACVSSSCQCTTPGTTLCGSACVNESTDNSNCGSCGHVCTAGTTCTAGTCTRVCGPAETLCGTACVNEQTDNNNCGACGHMCTASQTCTAGTCVEKTIASSCLPSSSLSVLIQPSKDVTAYVPLGAWTSASAGVNVVRVEGAPMAPTSVATGVVNSCSSCSSAACGVTGITVCAGNSNDLYVITPPATLSATPTANATALEFFSGGSCKTCGVAIDAATGKAWLEEGSSTSTGQLEPYNIGTGTFGSPIGLFGQRTSENISVDPVRGLILSANEGNRFQIINTATGAVFNDTALVVSGGEMDSTAADCSTGIALAPLEFTTMVFFVNLQGVTFTAGSPGTWTGPTNLQDLGPDFSTLVAGNSGSAVAPGSHLAVIAGEFGGSSFGVLQLQTAVTPATVPAATDWVEADVPNDPSGFPWAMGTDPHTVTAFVSPNDGKAYALMSNNARTFLVKVDMAALLGAPRLTAHKANPATIPAGTFTFIPQ
jgi:hypothetical protein